MKLVGKVGISILAMLLAALPVVACARPGAAMTAAEHDCCKRMAEQCGRSGMAKSHGCCRTQVSPSDSHALKASSSQLDHSLLELHAQPIALQAIADPQLMFSTSIPSATHSPPGLRSSATTVLRI
ncbi:MAG: hypothetical protein DMG70_04540 [Acidobacteria bacterium]|nr:MAG: hypothetical protein DMG70_04540 [Acidobacteriota bacterium]PYY04013.1 MAG: hypothetical protein DMG69_31535 [Acidobacteriota bacterium]